MAALEQREQNPVTAGLRSPSASRAGERADHRSRVPALSSAAAEHSPSAAAEVRYDGGPVDTMRQPDSALPEADVAAATDAGRLALASEGQQQAHDVTAATVTATRQLRELAPPEGADVWDDAGLGRVIPVLPASPGAGASTVAVVLADALAELGWRTLLVDTAEPARSGLGWAANADGPVTAVTGVEEVRLRWSWRRRVLLARPETPLPVLAPGMVPPPPCWRPPRQIGVPQITVADLSYDAWRLAAHPLSGPGVWLRAGAVSPRPVLVVRSSRPSLRLAEGVLTRLETWTSSGAAVSPAALAVLGGQKRWPPGVVGAAGRRVSALLDRAVFLPYDSTLATDGITPDLTPLRLREALAPLLRAWGLAPTTPPHDKRRLFRRGRR